MATWESQWQAAVDPIRADVHFSESAEQLRTLIRTGLLRFDDMEKNPERFFLAHRMLVDPIKRGPGFWIRFTVQYNLFAGTVLGLGGPEQLQELEEIQQKGQLGCFGLTERFAGVNSGLVVNTTATWVPETQTFLLHSPDDGAAKNWISQGLVADKCTVIADLRIGGKSYGPHGFLMDLRCDGQLVQGVILGDMGRKTAGNDLDNAWIKFDNVVLAESRLLNKFCRIRDNKYVQTTKERMRIEVIGQRLLTGRVAVAQAALSFTRKLYASSRKYSDTKQCWAPGAKQTLSSIPHLNKLYRDGATHLDSLDAFLAAVEAELATCLRNDTIPSAGLVQKIAVSKVRAVEDSIALCFKLKQEVGSYALMGDTGFENTDFLQCCKFAEGDSRILMQKLARDRVKAFKKGDKGSGDETRLCEVLAKAGKQGWDDHFEDVYELANVVLTNVFTASKL